MNSTNKIIVTDFMETIWNQRQFPKLAHFLAVGFTDHSLPPALPLNEEGTKSWIIATGKSFEHKTFIDELICENDKVVVKLTMHLKHIGEWRNMAATYKTIQTGGYRLFRLSDGKIIEHWGLIDASAIESQLRDVSLSCKVNR